MQVVVDWSVRYPSQTYGHTPTLIGREAFFPMLHTQFASVHHRNEFVAEVRTTTKEDMLRMQALLREHRILHSSEKHYNPHYSFRQYLVGDATESPYLFLSQSAASGPLSVFHHESRIGPFPYQGELVWQKRFIDESNRWQKQHAATETLLHYGDSSGLIKIATYPVMQAMLAEGLRGLDFVRIRPAKWKTLDGNWDGADFHVKAGGRYGIKDFELFDPMPDSKSCFALAPSALMPPQHPELTRYDGRVPTGMPRKVVTDLRYRGPVMAFVKRMFPILPIWTPEAIANAPDVDIMRSWEHFDDSELTADLLATARGRDVLSKYLLEPRWEPVGVAPMGSPLLKEGEELEWEKLEEREKAQGLPDAPGDIR
jgi:hypothetical protein